MVTYSLSIINERNGRCITVHIDDAEQRQQIARALMSGKDFSIGIDPGRSIAGSGYYGDEDEAD